MLVESLLKLQKHDGLPDMVDSASGKIPKGHLVGKARQEEMEYFFGMNVYTKVPESEAWDRTGKRPIGVRWVDVNRRLGAKTEGFPTGNPSPAPSTRTARTHRTHDTTDQRREVVWRLGRK